MSNYERPARHGALLGKALAAMAEAGREAHPDLIPAACATCAFTEGTMPNQMATTGLVALNCAMRIDKDRFACHHGMVDGQSTRICSGYLAAKRAPFSTMRVIMDRLKAELPSLESEGRDELRAEYDAWKAVFDPDEKLDQYQLARAWAKRKPPNAAA